MWSYPRSIRTTGTWWRAGLSCMLRSVRIKNWQEKWLDLGIPMAWVLMVIGSLSPSASLPSPHQTDVQSLLCNVLSDILLFSSVLCAWLRSCLLSAAWLHEPMVFMSVSHLAKDYTVSGQIESKIQEQSKSFVVAWKGGGEWKGTGQTLRFTFLICVVKYII